MTSPFLSSVRFFYFSFISCRLYTPGTAEVVVLNVGYTCVASNSYRKTQKNLKNSQVKREAYLPEYEFAITRIIWQFSANLSPPLMITSV